MTTRDEARKARDIVKRHLGRLSWLRGIGITGDGHGGYAVQVNVEFITPEVIFTVPNHVHLKPVPHPHPSTDCIPVVVVAVGDARAL